MRKFFSTLLLIILIVLVIVFRTDLLAIGVRIYAAATDSPRADRLLAEYYRNNAALNVELANSFYYASLEGYKKAIPTIKDNDQKAVIYYRIGRFYECGNVVPKNLAEAKRWYEQSNKIAKKPELAQQSKDALDRVSKASGNTAAPVVPSANAGTAQTPGTTQTAGTAVTPGTPETAGTPGIAGTPGTAAPTGSAQTVGAPQTAGSTQTTGTAPAAAAATTAPATTGSESTPAVCTEESIFNYVFQPDKY